MAARVHLKDICSVHHLVTRSEWSDRSLLETVSGKVLSALTQSEIEKSV
ncbi:hypothetical protein KMZ15_07160 [Mycoavidus sp. HKI]|nr:hypothetical protein [Mycoavidus sp. HKI]UAW63834.2 hypothetical protein KMZ15_07160 [Mycoavidus sp. HKI]